MLHGWGEPSGQVLFDLATLTVLSGRPTSDGWPDPRIDDTGYPNLDDARLLCHRHHRVIHDPRYDTTHLPDGTVRFHRRT